MGYIKFSQLPISTDVASDDYYAVLDSSENILKRSVVSHASEDGTYGLGTSEKYGHNKVVDNLTSSAPVPGESLSAHQGNVIANNIGWLETSTTASHHHDVDEYFMLIDKFVYSVHEIQVGDTINIGTNVKTTTVGDTFTEFKKSFQAGVDEIYEACRTAGITPASSAPKDIRDAILQAASGTATASDVLKDKTFLAGNEWRSGSIETKTGNVGTGTPSRNNLEVNVGVPAGFYAANGAVVTCDGRTVYREGISDGTAKGHEDYITKTLIASVVLRVGDNNGTVALADEAGTVYAATDFAIPSSATPTTYTASIVARISYAHGIVPIG